MLSAHMDEVGFMLVADDGEGLFRFETVGGIDVRQLPGKAVLVGREHVPGVIGARPIHLTTLEERKEENSVGDLADRYRPRQQQSQTRRPGNLRHPFPPERPVPDGQGAG